MRAPIHVSLLLCVTAAVSGCSKKDQEPPSAQQATPPAKAEAADEGPALIPAKPLTIAYSDWPGWVAWDIGVQKGWFAEEGVNVELKWFEYVPSMDAFSAGKVDAVAMTNGDALVVGATGLPSKAILINDYSNGNDMVVARPGIGSVAELKGKKVGVEVGFVSHLLLLKALESAGLSDDDISIVNVPTDQTPQTLASGAADAIVAWQPNSGQALTELAGSQAIFTSANVPGLIYDLLCVRPDSLVQEREAWKKVIKVWLRIADYLADEANRDEALQIMSARVGLTPERYAPLLGGTYFLGLDGNLKHFAAGSDPVAGDGLDSVHGSSKIVGAFQVANEVYDQALDTSAYFDDSLLREVAAEVRAQK
ncbi:ABC transporter substrate-binding protein [Haliangium sp.]|uniref:ABC transporter substrate-binding protein n=1 Tax=Haliangium sp. TaxID=2663208 RepID=UPI003D09B28B